MNSNLNLNDTSAADVEDCSTRRSSRLIKRTKFYDQFSDLNSTVESTIALNNHHSKRQSTRCETQTSNILTTSSVTENDISSAYSISKTVKVISKPSISITKQRKIPSYKGASSAINIFTGLPYTFTSSSSSSKKKKATNLNKKLGFWKPTDDLMLIQNVLQTNDLTLVHKGVKFSCLFSLEEIEQRWKNLLYDPAISTISKAAIQNLHPECVAKIESNVLFSIEEEELLATVQSNVKFTVDIFQELLDQHPNIFYRRRTAKILMHHWQLMKQYSLLSDQCSSLSNPIPIPLLSALENRNMQVLNNEQQITTITTEHIPTFAECEYLLSDQQVLDETFDPLIERHYSLIDKKTKRQIKVIEEEIPRSQVLVFPITGIDPLEFEPQTLAVLRGLLVRYLMRSKEITIGRTTKYQTVDVDLTLEGPAWKISRQQATICLSDTGVFLITCEGKKCLYVDGKPVITGSHIQLNHNSVLEIADLKFIFLINKTLVHKVLQTTLIKK